MTDTNPEPFVPYRDRPPLDKGEIITWASLESGMLFEPGALSDPRRRRVRGTPIRVEANRSYIIGSEDLDGTPKGGIEGCDTDMYRRTFDENGYPVYVIDYTLSWKADLVEERRVRDKMAAFLFDCWIDRAFFEEHEYDDPTVTAHQFRSEGDDFWTAGAKIADCRLPANYERELIAERFIELATKRPRS